MEAHTAPPTAEAVAHRLLGSSAEADEAVRAVTHVVTGTAPGAGTAPAAAPARSAATGSGDSAPASGDSADDLLAVARFCLDRLRSREAMRPAPRDPWDQWPERGTDGTGQDVLDTLTPSERVAFVLHEDFSLPYEEIAPLVDRTPTAARRLVARARRRVEGTEEMPEPDLPRQREVVLAFLAAARAGGTEALLALLDPDVVLRADAEAVRNGAAPAHGAPAVAHRVAGRAQEARPALVDGATGLMWTTPEGEPKAVLRFTVLEGHVTAIDALADRSHLDRLDLRPTES
ncbi:sigma factor-like helix-turn-helix DNA-binding protein [Streptomyces sp. NPDC053493]|uniref:sigma factor-like helix-turn-helix DNA-binding protein n=1 Tax=Streptomyces sp. NPDC053493 TaxID=3365705 RepID=UPI0037D3A93A